MKTHFKTMVAFLLVILLSLMLFLPVASAKPGAPEALGIRRRGGYCR